MGEVIDVNAPAWLSPEGALLIGRDTVTGSAFYPPRPLAPRTLNVADAVAAVQCRMARAAGQGQPCARRAISAIAAAGLRALAALMK